MMKSVFRLELTSILFAGALAASGSACSGSAEKAAMVAKADTLVETKRYAEAATEARRVLERDSKSPSANRILGRAHLELGEYAQANHYLLKAHASEPNAREVRLDLAKLYLIAGRPDDARDQAYTVLDSDSLNLAALVVLAGAAKTPREIDEAIRRLESARRLFSSDARPRLALASLHQRRSNPSSAQQLYQEAVAADPRSATVRATAGILGSENKGSSSNNAPRASVALAGATPGSASEIANSLILLGQRAEAKRVLSGALQSGVDVAARRILAELALSDLDGPAAEEVVAPLLQKDSADVEALLQRGRARLMEQRFEESVKDFQRARKAAPDLGPVHYYLGSALARAGRVNEGQSELDAANKMMRIYPEAVTELAAVNIRQRIPRASIGDAERLVRTTPRSMTARRVLGDLLIAARRPAEASETFRAAIKDSPERPEPHYWLGVSLAQEGKKAEATKELETALTMGPDNKEALLQLVTADLAEGHTDVALNRVTKQIRAAPQSGAFYNILGFIHDRRNENAAAEAAYAKAVELDPRLVDARIRLTQLMVRTGRFDPAIAQGEAARKLDSRNVSALIALGVAYQRKGLVPNARQAYEQALTVDPNSVAAANNLALLLSDASSDQSEAMKYAAMALRRVPNDPHIQDTAGWILFKAGNFLEALRVLRESAARLPDSPDVQYHLGMAAQKAGDTTVARQALTKAVQSPIGFSGREDARRALSTLK
jgi:tetratricopeptide (TPR) repeat protein